MSSAAGRSFGVYLERRVLAILFLGFSSGLPILLVYYPLLMYSVDRAKNGALPPYSVWLGNAILLACGAWLLRKVFRY